MDWLASMAEHDAESQRGSFLIGWFSSRLYLDNALTQVIVRATSTQMNFLWLRSGVWFCSHKQQGHLSPLVNGPMSHKTWM